MGSNVNFRSPAGLTAIGIGATLVITAAVVVVLLLFGGGAKAVSDNAALIGALIALGGVFTTQMVNSALETQRAEAARKTEHAQRERELEVGGQRAQDDAVQAYLDQMTNLLLDKDSPLRQSKEEDEVRTLARARTLTVLSRLDGTRKGNVVQFLYESHLITKEQDLVYLMHADLSGAILSEANLKRANLSITDLSGTNLSEADLSGADLSVADLSGAILTEANLTGANLTEATMPDGQKYEDPHKDREGREEGS
jgi:hypothetical protein